MSIEVPGDIHVHSVQPDVVIEVGEVVVTLGEPPADINNAHVDPVDRRSEPASR